MNKSVPRIDYTGTEYPLETESRHKTQAANAKHAVSMYSFRKLLHTFAVYLYLLVRGPEFEKIWPLKT